MNASERTAIVERYRRLASLYALHNSGHARAVAWSRHEQTVTGYVSIGTRQAIQRLSAACQYREQCIRDHLASYSPWCTRRLSVIWLVYYLSPIQLHQDLDPPVMPADASPFGCEYRDFCLRRNRAIGA